MRHYRIVFVVSLMGILATAVLPITLSAQQFKDCRVVGGCTEEDYAKGLFPEGGSDIRMRGVGPVRPQEPAAASPSVALNVFFEFNSDTILPRYFSEIDKLGKVLSMPQYAQYRIGVEGHTDSVGSSSYNQRLSERRAESVKRYLVRNFSIEPRRLIVKGYGELKPRASNDTVEGRDENRRVEVVNLGK